MENKEKRPVGRQKRTDKDNLIVPGAERGTKPGESRKSYIVNMELADKIDYIAWFDRSKIKEVVNEAFVNHVAKWEKKNGTIKLDRRKV